ncbi:protease SohB [Gynuella sunshinyii]|uniref:Periplasmic serine protease (ClpP class) n=1 Tax=Gynuella sunshinyii YC6258 TaxID=1445510 RepID=A0A0C5VPR4_9GAMM|nr:protease SohB [Gynuella sunshinyii]AJQ95413.1 periplasmic serine protease (ClpP class) [Gynuella sunshinyii YC6258]
MAEYGIFLLKTITLVIAFGFIVMILVSAGSKQKKAGKGQLEIYKLNDRLDGYKKQISQILLDKKEQKKINKEEKKREKANRKRSEPAKRRVFVINFVGDMAASAVSNLREEVSAILAVASEKDEVVLKLESPGGAAHSYGLAASQLTRIKEKGLGLTVCVDKVAASGGYMMACVGDKILSAPFAIIGSIGVVAQLPNFHRLLKKNDIDVELHTAGEFKRTLTMLGENTEAGREKFKQELEALHQLFKEFVRKNRSQLDIDKVATGEFWMGAEALDLKLVDKIGTSDQYLMDLSANADVFEVIYRRKKAIPERLMHSASQGVLESFSKFSQIWNWQK